jgi:hypothetical protein
MELARVVPATVPHPLGAKTVFVIEVLRESRWQPVSSAQFETRGDAKAAARRLALRLME